MQSTMTPIFSSRIKRFLKHRLLTKHLFKVKRTGKLFKAFFTLILVLFSSGITNLAFVTPVHADPFYPDGDVGGCRFATVVGVQYNDIGGNGVSWDNGNVSGESGSYIQNHHFTQVADITYPDAHKYPYIADRVAVPPNTRVEIGEWSYSYADHGVNLDAFHFFTSRPNPADGDLTRLGAGGSYGTIYMNGFPARSGKYVTSGYIGYFPDRVSSYGHVFYSFDTVQPIQLQNFTASPIWNGQNLTVRYTAVVRNVSAYNLCNIRFRDVLPTGAVYDQTFCVNSGQNVTLTYDENWGTNYPNTIINDPATIWDNNWHEETQSETQPSIYDVGNPAIRPGVVARDDLGAPASWNANQPVWGQIERPPINVVLIPYWFSSGQVRLDVPPVLSVQKTVSDNDETNVEANESRPDEEITYNITVSNTGGRATGVTVTDDYDQSLISIINADGGNDNGDTIIWNVGELQHGETRSFTVQARTISPLAHGTYLAPNTAIVDSDQTSPVDDSAQTNITAEVIMEIDKTVTDSDETNSSSNNIQGAHPDNTERLSTYSIYILNSGDADAHSVVISDNVSEIIRKGSIVNIENGGVLTTNIDPSGQLVGEIVWNIGDLPQKEDRNVRFTVQFNTGIDDNTQINNIAEVRTQEVSPVNDSTITIIHSPVLEITKDDGIEYAEPSQSVHWVINVKNTGTGNAYNTEVYDFVPERMTVSNISDEGAWESSTRRIIWSATEPQYILNGSYQPDERSIWGDSKQLSFDAQLDQKFLDGDTILTNLAVLETNFYPPIEAEHELPVLTPILEIEKLQELPEVVAPGQSIIYTIVYRNTGTGHAPETMITDTVPEHTKFVEFIETDSNGTGVFNAETDEIQWELGTLDPDSEGSVSFMVVIEIPTQSDTEIRNVALIESPITEQIESEVVTSVASSCCVGGFIWEDENNNGNYDENEIGIPDVRINLKWGETEYLESNEIDIYTEQNGHYEYTGLPYHSLSYSYLCKSI